MFKFKLLNKNIMEDELVSFKTAKLAKEKRFDIEVHECFKDTPIVHQRAVISIRGGDHNSCKAMNLISRPTQSLLKKWLREKKLLSISTFYNYQKEEKGKYGIIKESFYQNWIVDMKNNNIITDISGYGSKTYEEALEKGLQEALKLI